MSSKTWKKILQFAEEKRRRKGANFERILDHLRKISNPLNFHNRNRFNRKPIQRLIIPPSESRPIHQSPLTTPPLFPEINLLASPTNLPPPPPTFSREQFVKLLLNRSFSPLFPARKKRREQRKKKKKKKRNVTTSLIS